MITLIMYCLNNFALKILIRGMYKYESEARVFCIVAIICAVIHIQWEKLVNVHTKRIQKYSEGSYYRLVPFKNLIKEHTHE